MPSAKQNAARARFKAASAQAKREGAKGKNYAIRVGQIMRGGGAKPSGGGSTGRRGVRAAASHYGGKARGFLNSMTPKKGAQALVIIDALSESASNAQRQWADPWDHATHTLAPLIDGAITAKGIGMAVEKGMSGLAKDVANWRIGGKMPKVTLARVVNSAPQFISTPIAIQRYRDQRARGGGTTHWNLFPRAAALTGIQVKNPRKVGDSRWLIPAHGSGADTLFKSVLASPVPVIAAGKIGSTLIAKAHVF